MTREDIIERMGWMPSAKNGMSDILDRIERIVNRAVEAEREACLQDLRELIPPIGGGPDETPMVRSELQWVVEQCIAAIRARGSK